MRKSFFVMVVMVSMIFAWAGVAQQPDDTVTVPDVTGQTVPQAAAALNAAGLALGAQTSFGWTEASGLPQNTISAQDAAPGTEVAFGTPIALTVLRSNNAVLIYDDNDITLVNQTGGNLDLNGISFRAIDGSGATFSAARWQGSIGVGDCTQLWSVGRTSPKDIEGCNENMFWLTTNNPAEHFWTAAGGTTQFALLQNGVERVVCPVSATGRCEFYLDSTATGDTLGYLYIAYTSDFWTIYNNSETSWMPLSGSGFSAIEEQLGTVIDISTIATYPELISRNGNALAPQQCLVYFLEGVDPADNPVDCQAISSISLAQPTWDVPIFVTSALDGEQRECPPLTPDRMTLCILPR